MRFIEPLKNYTYRTLIFNALNCLFSLGFLIYTIVIVILLQSMWYIFLGAYYFILLAIRFTVLYCAYKNANYPQDNQTYFLKLYRLYGIIFIMLILLFAFIFLVDFKIYMNHRFTMPLFIFSGYAAVKFIFAIYNFIKAHKTQNIFVKILRNLSLMDAFMTVYIMQTFVATYILGKNLNTIWIYHFMEMMGGIFITIVAVTLGISMLVEAKLKMKKLKTAIEEDEYLL